MSYVISIANEKGGVAKTTTTLSMGGALVEMGKKVLLVDLDPQANLTLSLGIDTDKKVLSLVNLFLEKKPADDAILPTQVNNLFIFPSNSDIRMAERLLPMQSDYHLILTKLLSSLKSHYDFILLDCPPFLGSVTLNALSSIDLLLIPTQAEFFSIYALRNLMALVRRVRTQYNSNLKS